jgi:hypothetical protein
VTFVIHLGDSSSGPTLGAIDAPEAYSAAVKASDHFFRVKQYPERISGWAPGSGAFRTRPRDGSSIPTMFYVRRP